MKLQPLRGDAFYYDMQPGTDIGARCARETKTRNDARFTRAAMRWSRLRKMPVSFRVYNMDAETGILTAEGSIFYDEVNANA